MEQATRGFPRQGKHAAILRQPGHALSPDAHRMRTTVDVYQEFEVNHNARAESRATEGVY
jgi:hypothetical protein